MTQSPSRGTKICKDCKAEGITKYRPAIYKGPRCYSHNNKRKNELRLRNHSSRIFKLYGITEEEYALIKESQGGKCFICQVATGAARSLAVDHDHKLETDDVEQKWRAVRGIICSVCNKMLGHAHDDPMMFLRAAAYLAAPPAQVLLREWRQDVFDPELQQGIDVQGGGSVPDALHENPQTWEP